MKRNNGFTLVEVLSVVTMIGVLIVITIPVLHNVFGTAKKAIKDMDKEALIDGAKLYANDLIHNNTTITFDTNGNQITKKVRYNTGSKEIDGYEFIEYAAQNGMSVTARYLVENGYFDTTCDYNEASNKCKVNPECEIRITFESTTALANPNCDQGDSCKKYYTLGDYSTSIVNENDCVIK